MDHDNSWSVGLVLAPGASVIGSLDAVCAFASAAEGKGRVSIEPCPGLCQPPNKQLQRTVRDKVPKHVRRCSAAELRRYTPSAAIGSLELFEELHRSGERNAIRSTGYAEFRLQASQSSLSLPSRGPRVFCKGRARRISRRDIGVSLRWAPR